MSEHDHHQLRISEERYALAVFGSDDGIWDWDLTSNAMYFSPRWKELLGFSEEEISDTPNEWFDRVHSEDISRLKSQLDEHLHGATPRLKSEFRLRAKNSNYRWVLCKGIAIRNDEGEAVRMAGSISDVTERKETERKLKKALSNLKFALASEKVLLDELDQKNKELMKLSITDGLTKLYNHRFLQERFDFEFKRAKRYSGLLSCLIIDLDHFKQVNDTYGHQFGDLVLCEIAEILKRKSREVDICGRYGGEEFMILTNLSLQDATIFAERIHGAVEKNVFSNGTHSIHITISVGIADYRNDITTKQQLIERADTALYQAKHEGRNTVRIWKEQEQVEESVLDQYGIDDLKSKFLELSNRMRTTYVESTNALVRAIDAKDHYTKEHSQNVAKYSVLLAKALNMPEKEVDVVKNAALLHDVGKIGIGQEILIKETGLTAKEFEIMKKHPLIGANILKDVKFLEKEIPIVLHHHERFDGKGYPHGLNGNEIPYGARILAIADSFDAMTTDRSYRKKMSQTQALDEIRRCGGTQFHKDMADVFIDLIERTNA
ncbi:MAG: hypothetical protein A2268_10340 [Candidatus Raymondbacteria bacterium RifOxyA12_full_50_37]|uniref:Diguanylate cyclase n=1 Tax=Candidatus Raymondbacteria bacterium RIFOXYD12_FULL_49_13 TaxID=1817890 RepID=A0A1F7FK88_UNCRA|nr:MAG: hypothetical protein A2268_10340 [Candidatus Raymondbacteria bacterium RifOxyA12_full_50_37]OGJ90161.1 MAG: hypothetical protein A2248_16820 [Candidatus Raymondbacteria bacterium RIFOXYA2_FULL_49_16]OGJ97232.1 MAG: hypothetical protein A2453_01310 [Candidatus Raymondbacteria bacterium RIFOXYC2_FULL_50_21]OGK04499.1 MAG: hypothetical protein A2350_15355 [Candidatus Raymondbacteria bacterium RifOxyB12_full_50_8]OGK06501.1 MAG: hypothetical protein A2487_21450 [Candidatus Raymondbacteria b